MNEYIIPVKFLMWLVGIIVTLGFIGHLGFITYGAAEAAIEAQKKDQISYGKFSRQLWSQPAKKK